MRKLIWLMLAVSLPAISANEGWWEDTNKLLPDLLNEGYVIVSFSSGSDVSRVDQPGAKLRYVLMNERSRRAALCTQFDPLTATPATFDCVLSRN